MKGQLRCWYIIYILHPYQNTSIFLTIFHSFANRFWHISHADICNSGGTWRVQRSWLINQIIHLWRASITRFVFRLRTNTKIMIVKLSHYSWYKSREGQYLNSFFVSLAFFRSIVCWSSLAKCKRPIFKVIQPFYNYS